MVSDPTVARLIFSLRVVWMVLLVECHGSSGGALCWAVTGRETSGLYSTASELCVPCSGNGGSWPGGMSGYVVLC